MKVWGILYHVHLSVCPSVDKILCTFIKHWNYTVWINLKTCSYVKVAAGLNRYEVGKFIVGKAFQTLHFTLNLMLVFLALCCELFYTLIHFIFVDAFNVPDLDHKKNLFRFVFFLWYVCYFLVLQMHAQGVLYCVQILKINLIPVVFFLISTHFYILVTSYMNLL